MKRISIIFLFLISFFLTFSPKAGFAQNCIQDYRDGCDENSFCCSFPNFTCQDHYCKPRTLICGGLTEPCCAPPNPKCLSPYTCQDNYCKIFNTPTPTPSCGLYQQPCCPGKICTGAGLTCQGTGFCQPKLPVSSNQECIRAGGVDCKSSCNPDTEREISVACPDDTRCCVALIPTIPPSTPEESGIDFQKILQIALPGYKAGKINLKDQNLNIGTLISAILPYIFVIAGLILFFFLITSGFELMTGAGNPESQKKAWAKLTNAFVGFIIIFLAYWIAQIIEAVLGIQIF